MKTLKAIKMSGLALAITVLNTGCVLFLSAVAAGVTIWYYGGDGGTTAEVTIEKPCLEVYQALVLAVAQDKTVDLVSSNLEEMTVVIKKGDKKTGSAVIEKIEGDKSCLLKVTADDGTDAEDIDNVLAMKVVSEVCKELGIKYELKEKK